MIMCGEWRSCAGVQMKSLCGREQKKLCAALYAFKYYSTGDLSPFLFCWWTCQTIITSYTAYQLNLFSHGDFYIPLLLMMQHSFLPPASFYHRETAVNVVFSPFIHFE